MPAMRVRGTAMRARLVQRGGPSATLSSTASPSRRSTQPLEPVPVRVDDETVGYVEVAALPAAGGSLEQVFASGQRQATWTAVLVAIGVALLLGLLLARRIVRPLRDLSAGTQALAAGDYAQRIDVPAGDEIGALARDFNHLAHSLAEAREARRRWGQDIAHELRTPIAVLQAELQTLIDGVRPLDRTVAHRLPCCRRSCRR